jgi:hypothetical protein
MEMIATLLLAAVLGQGIRYDPQPTGQYNQGMPVESRYSVRAALDWSTCNVYATSERATITRASVEPCQCSDGTWQAGATNALCSDGVGGAWIGPAGQNTVTVSETLTGGPWNAGGATVTHQSAQCPMAPDGSARMDLITVSADGQGPYTAVAHTTGNPVANSVWVALKTGDSTCTMHVSDAYDASKSVNPSITAAPVRYGAAGVNAQSATGVWLSRFAGDTCTNWCAWGAQNETNSAAVSPYYKTTGTAVSWPATVVTVPKATGLTDAQGAVGVTFTAASNVYPNTLVGVGMDFLLVFGTDTAVRIYDGTTELPAFTVPSMYSESTMFVSWSSAASLMYLTGPGITTNSHSYDGAFVGGWNSFTIGSPNGASYWAAGRYKRFVQCTSIRGCR